MEIVQKYNWCASELMTSSTKIMKLNLTFASDTELQSELGSYEHIDPVKSKDFLVYFEHFVSIFDKLEGGDMLLAKVELDPEMSNKKQLIHQADVSAITALDIDFNSPDPDFDALKAPAKVKKPPPPTGSAKPIRQMQMLATEIKFSAASHFQTCNNDNVVHDTDDDNPHEVVQVIDDDDLGNEDVCANNVGNTGMNVIETDALDLLIFREICPVFENDIDDEDSIPALAVHDHDGDTIGNGDDVPDLLCCHTHKSSTLICSPVPVPVPVLVPVSSSVPVLLLFASVPSSA